MNVNLNGEGNIVYHDHIRLPVTDALSMLFYTWEREQVPSCVSLRTLIPYLFQTSEILHIILRLEHERNTKSTNTVRELNNYSVNGRNHTLFVGPSDIESYARMRTAIALVSEIKAVKDALFKSDAAGCLTGTPLHDELCGAFREIEKFKKFRNYMTHFGERLVAPEKHGVSGSHKIDELGIEFLSSSENCMLLAMVYPTVSYTEHGKLCTQEFSLPAFSGYFQRLRGFYRTFQEWASKNQRLPYPPIVPFLKVFPTE